MIRSISYHVTISRDELRAHEARRWLGVAGPRLYNLKVAECRRLEVAMWLRDRQATLGRLFPPPPPELAP